VRTKKALKTVTLLAALTVLSAWIGIALGGVTGLIVALVVALIVNAVTYWCSGRITLFMTGARPLPRDQAPLLYDLVEELATRARLPVPSVHVIRDPSPNAFATGRNSRRAAMVVTAGLLDLLTAEELSSVLAHEFAHIKDRDILVSAIVVAIAGMITGLARLFRFAAPFNRHDYDDERHGLLGDVVFVLVAPIAATLLQLVIARRWEFVADAEGGRLCGAPMSLAGALRKLEQGTWLRPMTVNPAAAPLFIVHPFAGGGMLRLFQTHPPTAERIARLQAMAGQTDPDTLITG
jgi:heat shock protein HtpX